VILPVLGVTAVELPNVLGVTAVELPKPQFGFSSLKF